MKYHCGHNRSTPLPLYYRGHHVTGSRPMTRVLVTSTGTKTLWGGGGLEQKLLPTVCIVCNFWFCPIITLLAPPSKAKGKRSVPVDCHDLEDILHQFFIARILCSAFLWIKNEVSLQAYAFVAYVQRRREAFCSIVFQVETSRLRKKKKKDKTTSVYRPKCQNSERKGSVTWYTKATGLPDSPTEGCYDVCLFSVHFSLRYKRSLLAVQPKKKVTQQK